MVPDRFGFQTVTDSQSEKPFFLPPPNGNQKKKSHGTRFKTRKGGDAADVGYWRQGGGCVDASLDPLLLKFVFFFLRKLCVGSVA